MANDKTGGPAFPRPDSQYTSHEAQEGMTVLDWFAGQIAAAHSIDWHMTIATQDKDQALLAVFSYGIAEALVQERERRLAHDSKGE